MIAFSRVHILLLAVVLSLLPTGCSMKDSAPTAEPLRQQEEETSSPPPTSTLAITLQYPAPSTQSAGGYPEATGKPLGPRPTTSAPAFIPVTPQPVLPEAGLGVVTGAMVRQLEGIPAMPMNDTTLYLAVLLPDSGGQVTGLARLNEESAPEALTDDAGQFVFRGVAPGQYALIIKTPLALIPARDAATSIDVVVDVIAGEVAELGVVSVRLAY